MKRSIVVACLLSMVVAMPARGQAQAVGTSQASERAESPYELSWLTDGVLSALTASSMGIASAVLGGRTPLTPEQAVELTPADLNWFDRSAASRYNGDAGPISENMGTAVTLAPLVLMLDPDIRRSWMSFGVMYVQTTLLAGSISKITKETVHRFRPYVYNPDLSYEEKTRRNPGGSFFSLAATHAFAQATFLATVFSDHHPDSRYKPYVWIGSLSAAAAIGYLRYDAGLHYPSDIVAGALVGGGVAWLIPRLHRVGRNRNITIAPTFNGVMVTVGE